jgi:hypothetical protein
MKLSTFVLSLFLCLGPYLALSQGRSHRPDVYQVFDSELVVRGQIVQNKTYRILVRIDEVIKDGKYGMKAGDHVWLKTGSSDNIVAFEPPYARGIFYLNKYPGHWSLNGHDAGVTISLRDSTRLASAE